jgi:hypothetical protein
MVELLPPEIKVTDLRIMDKSGDPIGSLDSPSTGDGSQSAGPKSSSSEGTFCFFKAPHGPHYVQ